MITLLLALLVQARPPTVGDTLWVTRQVTVPRGQTVRPAGWELSGDVELLGRPRVTTVNGVVEVAYPVVVWTAGSHTVHVPGPLLLAADGGVDSLPAADTTLVVASVLPANAPDSALHPQPVAGLVHRRVVAWLPVAILLAAAFILLVPLHWWWRRRGQPAATAARRPVVEPPLARWAEAGESRTVLAVAAARLRRAIAARLPAAHPGLDTPAVVNQLGAAPADWPVADIADTLAALDAARFGGEPPDGALALFARAMELAGRVSAAETPA